MPLIQIDDELCSKDGLCIRECPFNLLIADETGVGDKRWSHLM